MGKLNKDEPNLSVIVLSFNTKDITCRTLDKLKISKEYCEKKLKNSIEVIVVDNGSEDGSVQAIESEYKWVKLEALKENTGFSKGNNIGMKIAKYSYILLLNSDVYVTEESLYKTLAYFRVNLNCDVMGARLKYSDGRLQPSAGSLPNPLNLFLWIFGLSLIPFINNFVTPFHPKSKSYFSKAHKVGWVMGAFFALRRKVFDATGGFDENLFMHMEEIEWCKRIKGKGFKTWYVPQVEVVHLHGASTNFDLGPSFLNELKGVKYFLKKHYPILYIPTKIFLLFGLILRIIIFYALRKTQRANIYIKGLSAI